MKLAPAQLKVLASSLFYYFRNLDRPPADEIYVPVDAIKPDRDEQNCYYATVRFVVNYCGRKVHSTRIKLHIDNNGRFIPSNWSYV